MLLTFVAVPLSPDDVKMALEELSTVGGVSVTLSHIGLALGSDGVMFPLNGDDGNENATSLFPVWTVAFDGDCSFAEGAWTSCPANTGDLEVGKVIPTLLGYIEPKHIPAYSTKLIVVVYLDAILILGRAHLSFKHGRLWGVGAAALYTVV